MTNEAYYLQPSPRSNRRALLKVAVLVEGGMLVVAVVLGLLLGTPFWAGARADLWSVALGIVAGLVLLAGAVAVTESALPFAVRMRQDIDRLLGLFRGATIGDFLLISILAGLGEEALFRGVIQGGLADFTGTPIAVVIAAAAFGLAHFISWAYVAFAFGLGLLFGALYLWSGNIAVPIIAHAAYDFVALCFVYRANRPATERAHGN